MNILIVHEVDWIKKVIFEPHHIAEKLSIKNNNVFVIDCRESDFKNFFEGFKNIEIKNFNRIYNNANITLIRPASILIKGLNRLSYFFTCKKIIKQVLQKNKIDIVLLYGVATNGIQTIQAANELKIPVIYRALDIAHGLINIPIIKESAKRCEKMVIKNSKTILVTTPDLGRYVIEMGAIKDHVSTFDLGVNLEMFRPKEKNITLLNNFGLSKTDKIIVFMGTVYDFAGLKNIILNFKKLQKNVNNVKLLIVGDGPNTSNLKKIIHNEKLEKDVIITGFIPQKDVSNYIALADICVNPFEINFVTNRILPTKILEYMACKKPVLSTPLAGTMEIMPNEKYGIKYSNSNEFIENLGQLLNDENKLEQLSSNGYEYLIENHDWNILVDKLYDYLIDMCKNNLKN